jgi:hypothetical protein
MSLTYTQLFLNVNRKTGFKGLADRDDELAALLAEDPS